MGPNYGNLHSITTDTTNRSTDFRGNTSRPEIGPAVAICPMAGDLLQFYTRATALVFLPLLKSRIRWLLSSYVLQKVTCTLRRAWWCLALPPHLPLGCKGAASAYHPAKGLGFCIPLAKWGWKSSEMPQVSAGLEGICGSLCAKTAFGEKGTAQVLMRAVTRWSTSRRTGFSTPRLTQSGS